MDQKIKKRILEMNKNGDGYKKIAAELNISVGSVRNALKEKEDSSYCRHCGKRLIFVPGKKKKTFCNDRCRYAYWNDRKEVKKNAR